MKGQIKYLESWINKNLLWDILRLPSSRRAALGLYMSLSRYDEDGARTSHHTHCCIGARRATHCATGDEAKSKQLYLLHNKAGSNTAYLLHIEAGSNTQHIFFPNGTFKDVVAGSSTQPVFFTMNPSPLSFVVDEFLFFRSFFSVFVLFCLVFFS